MQAKEACRLTDMGSFVFRKIRLEMAPTAVRAVFARRNNSGVLHRY